MEYISTSKFLLLLLVISAFHTGLIWVIQLVHYPGFLHITGPGYPAYQQFHMKAISYIVAPSMGLELLLSIAFIAHIGQSSWLYWVTIVLLVVIWVVTVFAAVPLHGSLTVGYDAEKIRQLVQVNWLRTIAWSVRTLVLGIMVWRLI